MWPTQYISAQLRIAGVPPPRTYYTTPPYPPEITEALSNEGALVSAEFSVGASDELEASSAFVSGVLDDILLGVDARFDELESSSSFVSGSLSAGLKTGYGGDELESLATFISGTLAELLIVYDNWPLGVASESLESTGSFVSGVVTGA